jgi:hypothetical protein
LSSTILWLLWVTAGGDRTYGYHVPLLDLFFVISNLISQTAQNIRLTQNFIHGKTKRHKVLFVKKNMTVNKILNLLSFRI